MPAGLPALTSLPTVETRGRIITAAGSADAMGQQVTGSGGAGVRSSKQGWQPEAWGFHDVVPELHYGTQFVGSCWSRIILRLGWENDSGEITSVYDDEGVIDDDVPAEVARLVVTAQAVLSAFTDPLGGQGALLEAIGKNLTVAGECHLLARDYHDAAGRVVARRWEVLSTDEIRRKKFVKRNRLTGELEGAEFERLLPGARTWTEIPPDQFVLRIYRRHPRWGHLADASTRPLLETMEVLALLVRQLRSTILSRLAGAGVLFVPTEADFPDDDTSPEGTKGQNVFQKKLIKAMSAPVADRAAAGAFVPFVVTMDADLITSVHHLTFDTKDDDIAIAKMDAMLLRFAQGMDLPVEVTMGHQNTTFANAVQVDESTYKAHIEPGVELAVGFLTAGYLWTSLGAQRPVDADPGEQILLPMAGDPITRLRIVADPSKLVTHEHREDNALKAGQQIPPIISASAERRALGFTDADAPSDDELNAWIRVRQLVNVRETIRAEESGTGGVTLADPAVEDALNPTGTASTGVDVTNDQPVGV